MARIISGLIACTATLLLPSHALITQDQFEKMCDDLASSLNVENGAISSIDFVPAGTNLTIPVDPSCPPGTQFVLVDFCRVTLDLATSDRSSTYMEAWLPRNWTGRFLATGNSGIGGCVHYWDMAYGAALGFATTGSNNGHWGMNGTTFLKNDDVIDDFAWRAVFSSGEAGKSISAQFYGNPHDRSYFMGCSTGGRQGLKMAQEFAELYDGILAGSPVVAFAHLLSALGSFNPLIKEAGPDGVPPPSTYDTIDNALLKQCDGLDGAHDNILDDPSLCHFNPNSLTCPSEAAITPTCLSKKQARLVHDLLSPIYGKDGVEIFPRMNPAPGIVASTIANFGGESQFLYTDHWFKFAVYNDPDLDTVHLTPEQWAHAWEKDPGGCNTWSGDLSAARDANTKILHYHGTADPLVTSFISNNYYDLVSETMGLLPAELDGFYRLFRVGGMGHCLGGTGPVHIGNYLIGAGLDRLPSLDPDENVLLALVRWVEDGAAPETITGTAYNGGDPGAGVEYKKRHCRYPTRNQLAKSGDFRDPDAWDCIERRTPRAGVI